MTINIQINIINVYRLDAFPEDRVNHLISELNVHYENINGYLEANINNDQINMEVINSFSKINEISRLAPRKINNHPYRGDFRLGVDLLNSILFLLKTGAGHESVRRKFLDLGWSFLYKLYDLSYAELIESSLLYHWLKNKNLVQSHGVVARRYRNYSADTRNEKRIFSPSSDEIHAFYEKNSQKIYEYMVYEMSEDKYPTNPFSDQHACDFYHYYQMLSEVEI